MHVLYVGWHGPWLNHAVVSLVFLSGCLNVWTALRPLSEPIFEQLLVESSATSRLFAGFAGLLLILLSFGLWRRQRSAWVLTVSLLGLSIVIYLLGGLNITTALVNLVLVGLLVAKRSYYVVPVNTSAVRRGLVALLLMMLFIGVYGGIGMVLINDNVPSSSPILPATAWRAIIQPATSDLEPMQRWFFSSLPTLFLAGVLLASVYALSPLVLTSLAPLDDKVRARALVEAYGCSSLAHFTLLGSKHYFFTEGDRAFIAYAVVNGIGLALGDPIGTADAIPEAITAFRDYCERHSWKAAFYQVLPNYLDRYREASLQVLPIGQEAVVDLAQFSKAGKAGKNFRAATNQLTKAGYQAKVYAPPQSTDRLAALRKVSDTWLHEKHGSEKVFSLGSFDESYLASSVIIVLEDSTNRPVAFANLVDEFQKNELTLDLMRSLSGLPEDSMLYLFVEMLEYAKAQGYDSFNLGLAALSGLSSSKQASFEERILATIFERFNQFYNFKGLQHFKNKFHPGWEMRYLIYPKRTDVIAVLSAVALADSSLGFWKEVRQELQRRLTERRAAKKMPSATTDQQPTSTTDLRTNATITSSRQPQHSKQQDKQHYDEQSKQNPTR
jgi:phosphatidylglycerol lysyltransferase